MHSVWALKWYSFNQSLTRTHMCSCVCSHNFIWELQYCKSKTYTQTDINVSIKHVTKPVYHHTLVVEIVIISSFRLYDRYGMFALPIPRLHISFKPNNVHGEHIGDTYKTFTQLFNDRYRPWSTITCIRNLHNWRISHTLVHDCGKRKYIIIISNITYLRHTNDNEN